MGAARRDCHARISDCTERMTADDPIHADRRNFYKVEKLTARLSRSVAAVSFRDASARHDPVMPHKPVDDGLLKSEKNATGDFSGIRWLKAI